MESREDFQNLKARFQSPGSEFSELPKKPPLPPGSHLPTLGFKLQPMPRAGLEKGPASGGPGAQREAPLPRKEAPRDPNPLAPASRRAPVITQKPQVTRGTVVSGTAFLTAQVASEALKGAGGVPRESAGPPPPGPPVWSKPQQPVGKFHRGLGTKALTSGAAPQASPPSGSPRTRLEPRGPDPPRRRPLPSERSLGPRPAKPPPPPGPVDLQRFRRARDTRAQEAKALLSFPPSPARRALGPHHFPRVQIPAGTPPTKLLTGPRSPDDIYDEVEPAELDRKSAELPQAHPSPTLKRSRAREDELHGAEKTPKGLPLPPSLLKQRAAHLPQGQVPNEKNPKQCKKEEKAEKEFRKKFKFEGDIVTLTRMMIDPSASSRRGGGKNLPLRRGEILDVIQFTSREQILCRDSQGKYGYIPRAVLLPLETEVYDDVGLWEVPDTKLSPQGYEAPRPKGLLGKRPETGDRTPVLVGLNISHPFRHH
ncbi:PML-RARA-regulated adapter molecule 1 isoform X1 [Ornithorhynchus anatinus]|uniref:PML-RARA-regulated adapter molecule 1 isoform X1 n=1 Tax=Ornithorhynchus anatinus TaxID=9258 RepID=UPI0010A90FFF|nr:PML-RARA-regulated adapter molecule 1 isoform X1 [Ornithorhynchus anatinus]